MKIQLLLVLVVILLFAPLAQAQTPIRDGYACPVFPDNDFLIEIFVDQEGQTWLWYSFHMIRVNPNGTVSEMDDTLNYLGGNGYRGAVKKVVILRPRNMTVVNGFTGEVTQDMPQIITLEGLTAWMSVYATYCLP